ncbi:RHS repeat-associated core domain-containing protein [Pseudomonas sp.]|uniref:RHS repeat-associated core domain-containing protein n=1 Tax=Pseudomonas sp. TaxID=306 RepID=UPI0028B051BB|nr:RHS repeat-associated core domain-containing protein [Pseudomonas sp.]
MTSHDAARSAYTPYGFSNGKSARFKFKGEYFNDHSQCYPLGAGRRSYSPVLMRFLSADVFSPFGMGGINAYAFVKGDPINLSDPSGNAPHPTPRPVFYYRGPIQVVDRMRVFYTEPEPGRQVLNIGAHGAPGRIRISIFKLKASAVVDALRRKGIEVAGKEVHVLACHSADRTEGGGPSFIEQMAAFTKAPVTGYRGVLWVDDNAPALVNGTFDNYWFKIIDQMDHADPNYALFDYRPHTVQPLPGGAAFQIEGRLNAVRSNARR